MRKFMYIRFKCLTLLIRSRFNKECIFIKHTLGISRVLQYKKSILAAGLADFQEYPGIIVQ